MIHKRNGINLILLIYLLGYSYCTYVIVHTYIRVLTRMSLHRQTFTNWSLHCLWLSNYQLDLSWITLYIHLLLSDQGKRYNRPQSAGIMLKLLCRSSCCYTCIRIIANDCVLIDARKLLRVLSNQSEFMLYVLNNVLLFCCFVFWSFAPLVPPQVPLPPPLFFYLDFSRWFADCPSMLKRTSPIIQWSFMTMVDANIFLIFTI